MIIDEKLILKLEKLARLELSADERLKLRGELEEIVEMIQSLEEVDTNQIEPLRHLGDVNNLLRTDKIGEHLPMTEVVKNASDSQPPYFKVPKVIDRTK